MAHAQQGLKRKRRKTALPFLGAAGASLALGGSASAATHPTMNVSSEHAAVPVLTLLEEELSDVSLGTFYVFDNAVGDSLLDEKVARAGGCGGCRGCGGARGCGGGRGCAAVARCGGGRGCAVGRCRCGGVGVVGCARCGCSCSGCTGTCWAWAFTGWAFVC
jgi:hypothetical protein